MNAPQHLATGVVAAAGWTLLGVHGPMPLRGVAWVASVSLLMVAVLAPDWDHPASLLSRRVPIGHWLWRRVMTGPLVWLVVAPWARSSRECQRRARAHPSALERALRHRAARRLLGAGRSERLAGTLGAGRAWADRAGAHRGLSHTLAAVAVSSTLVALAVASLPALAHAAGAALGPWVAQAAAGHPPLTQAVTRWGRLAYAMPHGVPAWLAAAWALGYVTHILGDMVTVQGVRLLAPWSDRRFWMLPHGWRLRTSRGQSAGPVRAAADEEQA